MKRLHKEERGATLFETSLILLVFLTVLFGVIEVGRLTLTYVTLSNAVREGVRYAIVHGSDRTGSGADGPSGPSDSSQVTTVVQTLTTAAGLSNANLTVTVTYPTGNSPASPVTVTAAYSYIPMVSFLPLTANLGSESEGIICY